jgi:hypothetical protein
MAFDDWRLGEGDQRGTSVPGSDLHTRLSRAVAAIREVTA